MTIVLIIFLLVSARLVRSAQKAYAEVPSRELRRRGAKGDELAHELYQAARYEGRLKFLLEIVIIILSSALFYLIFSELSSGVAFTLNILVLLYLFAFSPSTSTRKFSRSFAKIIAPILSSLMKALNPLIYVIKPANFGERVYQDFYDLTDLIDFLHSQAKVKGSRISKAEVERAIEALEHRDSLIREIMTPKKEMVTLRKNEKVGPILLSELHKSKQSFFAIVRKGEIDGIASLSKLAGMKEGGEVADAMKHRVAYVYQDWLLTEAANAYLKTKEKAFLVINQKNEVVGIVSFDVILEKLVGIEYKEDIDFYNSEEVAENGSSK